MLTFLLYFDVYMSIVSFFKARGPETLLQTKQVAVKEFESVKSLTLNDGKNARPGGSYWSFVNK